MKKYVIINSGEINSINFDEVLETSIDTLRYSLDGSKTFVKFKDNTPEFLKNKTQYSHSEIIEILQSSDWYEEED